MDRSELIDNIHINLARTKALFHSLEQESFFDMNLGMSGLELKELKHLNSRLQKLYDSLYAVENDWESRD